MSFPLFSSLHTLLYTPFCSLSNSCLPQLIIVFLLPLPQRQRQLQPIVSGCKVEDLRLQIRELEQPLSSASVGWKNMSYDTAHAPVSGLSSYAAIQEICPGLAYCVYEEKQCSFPVETKLRVCFPTAVDWARARCSCTGLWCQHLGGGGRRLRHSRSSPTK